MFTGIIEHMGHVASASPCDGGLRLVVTPDAPARNLAIGESIAVNGVCLTVDPDSTPTSLLFYLSDETIRRTTLGGLDEGGAVNLERALRADSRLGGHLVSGHVDAVGRLRAIEHWGEGCTLTVEYPARLAPMIAAKGSIAVDGISLTVVDLLTDAFTVAVIPHTVAVTNLAQARAGAPVNLEVDMLARYVLRAVQALAPRASGTSPAGLTGDLLVRAGFIE